MMTNSAYINDAVMQLQIILDVCKENDTYTFIKMFFFPAGTLENPQKLLFTDLFCF